MAYNIYNADGTPISIADNAFDDKFYNKDANGTNKGVGIRLLGRNVLDYGGAVAQDFIQLLSNFSSPNVLNDNTSVKGQLWFNSSDSNLYVRVQDKGVTGGILNWKQVGNAMPQIGTPLWTPANVLLGYSTASIPTTESINDYVSLDTYNHVWFAGWARKVSGKGMTTALLGLGDVVIGYVFPPIAAV